MDGESFLDVADRLLEGETEADWRSAVSRAYYAAFHVGRQFLLDCGFHLPRGEQSHGAVIVRLSNAGYPEVVEAGRNLNDLRTLRNLADYDLAISFHHTKANDLVINAGRVVEILQSGSHEPIVKAKVTDAIKIYERNVLRQVTWRA